jgi:hypothetical protein
VDTIHLRARLDAIEARLNLLDGDGGRHPSHGTRGSLSRPIIDGGVQPRDVHELNDVPEDRDDDLMPLEGDEPDDQAGDQAADQAGDQVADQAGDQARGAATRRRAASTGSRTQARKRVRSKGSRGRR